MTIQQQIDNAREHLDRGDENDFNDYGYKAIMSAAIRSAKSTRALNRFRAAIKEDGMVILDNKTCPLAGDIVTVEELHLRHGMSPGLARTYRELYNSAQEHKVNSETDDDVSDWLKGYL